MINRACSRRRRARARRWIRERFTPGETSPCARGVSSTDPGSPGERDETSPNGYTEISQFLTDQIVDETVARRSNSTLIRETDSAGIRKLIAIGIRNYVAVEETKQPPPNIPSLDFSCSRRLKIGDFICFGREIETLRLKIISTISRSFRIFLFLRDVRLWVDKSLKWCSQIVSLMKMKFCHRRQEKFRTSTFDQIVTIKFQRTAFFLPLEENMKKNSFRT